MHRWVFSIVAIAKSQSSAENSFPEIFEIHLQLLIHHFRITVYRIEYYVEPQWKWLGECMRIDNEFCNQDAASEHNSIRVVLSVNLIFVVLIERVDKI